MHSLLSYLFESLVGSWAAVWLLVVGDVLGLLHVPSVLLRRQGRPLAALTWIVVLLTVPFGGVALWWFLGRTHLKRPAMKRRRSRARLMAGSMRANEERTPPSGLRQKLPFVYEPRRWTEGVFPPVSMPTPELEVGAEAFRLLERGIAAAEREIRLLFYIWKADATGRRILDRLTEKARAGVRVRLLVDGMGSTELHGSVMRPFLEAGGRFAVFLPVRFRPWTPNINFRNHRKLVVIDGEAAFTGGMNIGHEYEAEWMDFFVRLRGPIVEHFDEVFREDWHFATGETLPALYPTKRRPKRGQTIGSIIAGGPDRVENRALDGYFSAIVQARQRIWLTSPYFVPGNALQVALRTAALRGVDVRILTPQQSDVPFVRLASHSFYERFLQAGMRVFEYTPRVLHAKALVVDDDLTVIGSANTDVRSFRLNFELVCFAVGKRLNRRLAELFESSLRESREIRLEQFSRRPRWLKAAESLAHLLSPVL